MKTIPRSRGAWQEISQFIGKSSLDGDEARRVRYLNFNRQAQETEARLEIVVTPSS